EGEDQLSRRCDLRIIAACGYHALDMRFARAVAGFASCGGAFLGGNCRVPCFGELLVFGLMTRAAGLGADVAFSGRGLHRGGRRWSPFWRQRLCCSRKAERRYEDEESDQACWSWHPA